MHTITTFIPDMNRTHRTEIEIKNDIIIIVKINSQKKNINYRMNNEWKNIKVN